MRATTDETTATGEVPEFPAKARSGTHSIVMKIDPHPDYTWDNNGAFQHIFLNQTQATAFTLSGRKGEEEGLKRRGARRGR